MNIGEKCDKNNKFDIEDVVPIENRCFSEQSLSGDLKVKISSRLYYLQAGMDKKLENKRLRLYNNTRGL